MLTLNQKFELKNILIVNALKELSNASNIRYLEKDTLLILGVAMYYVKIGRIVSETAEELEESLFNTQQVTIGQAISRNEYLILDLWSKEKVRNVVKAYLETLKSKESLSKTYDFEDYGKKLNTLIDLLNGIN
ncbi:hypothetical protein C518_2411 [Lysinibacillus fusiformis ZB2]|nr:hypothetical protein C518_2411 [Lysinibacillus fusiformis ZB2]